jgi:hypothetical protein
MNRTTRLSLIAVMLLATTALGIIGYKAMYPDVPPPPPKEEPVKDHPPPQIVYPEPKEPQPNPEYVRLQTNLKQHEQHCLQLGRESMTPTIVLDAKNQTNFDQRVQACWNLVKIEREYVTNFPAKTIQ